MKRYFYILIFVFSFVLVGSFIFGQEPVTFPVEELGGCRSFKECANFCDKPENFKVCNDFAEAHGMVAPEQTSQTRQVLELADIGGPGGCQGQEECEAYCSLPDHMEECIIFAKEHNLIPPEELKEAEMVLAAIKKGVKPPACPGKKACDIYCSQPEHLEECLAFGEAAGFISAEEVEMARRTGGKGPGNCRGREECDAFCQDPANMEECITFGLEYGFIPPEEIENVKKTLEALKKGVKPPNCRGQEECDKYCSQPEHAEECVDFAVAAGFIAPEEAEQARKMAKLGIMSGPGGCKGKEECEDFCDNPDNMLECVSFGLEYGLMPPEEVENAKKTLEALKKGVKPPACKGKEECDIYCSQPESAQNCIDFAVAAGFMSPEEAEVVKEFGPEGPGGPGGCRGEEECRAYCSQPEHSEECINFSLERGLMSPEEAEKMREMMRMPPPEMPQPMPEGMMPPPEGMAPPSPGEMIQPPPGEMIPPPEQIQPPPLVPEVSPPPAVPAEGIPQTLLKLLPEFLANTVAAFLELK